MLLSNIIEKGWPYRVKISARGISGEYDVEVINDFGRAIYKEWAIVFDIAKKKAITMVHEIENCGGSATIKWY